MRYLVAAFLGLALAAAASGPAVAQDETLVRKASPYSVSATLDRLAKIVQGKGAAVFARIDHAKGADKVGATLRPTETLIFGNPKIGTPVMLEAQEAGLDLPLRVLVYEAADGKVWLVYREPAAVGVAHGLAPDAASTQAIGKAINGLTNAAIAVK